MKIKLVEPGWEGFTGLFGVVQFEDGVSVEDVSKGEAQHLSALVRIETLEGKDPSVAQEIVDRNNELAAVEPVIAVNDPEAAPVVARKYTLSELEGIADNGGIAALREVAESLGVKGRSIPDLIARVFEVAGEKTDSPEPITPQDTETAELAAAAAAELLDSAIDLAAVEADLAAEEADLEQAVGEVGEQAAN